MFALTKRNIPAFFAAAALFAGMPLSAQVELSLTIEPAKAILCEPVSARVVIRNNTGGILTFDAEHDSARFFFELERSRNIAVKQNDRTPLLYGLKIVPGEIVTNLFNLTSLYAMQTHGLYKLRAYLEWNNLLFASRPFELEMLKGFEITKLIAGVPGGQGAMRAYILEYMTKENGEQVYLRIEDSDSSAIYGMYNLGHIVRVRQPEMKVDEAGNVHVLFQTMAMVFVHTAFTPYGVQLFSRSYADKNNKIALVNLPNGRVSVSPLPTKSQEAAGNAALPQDSSSTTQRVPGKVRLGRGGLFGPKPE